jgi:hypothetical protein
MPAKNKTKIVCTIGPASASPEVMLQLRQRRDECCPAQLLARRILLAWYRDRQSSPRCRHGRKAADDHGGPSGAEDPNRVNWPKSPSSWGAAIAFALDH